MYISILRMETVSISKSQLTTYIYKIPPLKQEPTPVQIVIGYIFRYSVPLEWGLVHKPVLIPKY
jgi:hypothetical protein